MNDSSLQSTERMLSELASRYYASVTQSAKSLDAEMASHTAEFQKGKDKVNKIWDEIGWTKTVAKIIFKIAGYEKEMSEAEKLGFGPFADLRGIEDPLSEAQRLNQQARATLETVKELFAKKDKLAEKYEDKEGVRVVSVIGEIKDYSEGKGSRLFWWLFIPTFFLFYISAIIAAIIAHYYHRWHRLNKSFMYFYSIMCDYANIDVLLDIELEKLQKIHDTRIKDSTRKHAELQYAHDSELRNAISAQAEEIEATTSAINAVAPPWSDPFWLNWSPVINN